MSTLKTHNLQSPDAGSVNIALTPNAGMVVAGVTTVTGTIETTGSELKITGAEPRLTFTDTDNNPDFQIWANAQKFAIYDSTNSATRLHINSSGNVGINETSPGQRLTIGGDIQIGFNTPNDAGRQLNFNVNRGSAGQTLANINWQWNSKFVAQIRGIAGADTTNKDDGHLAFFTSAANSLVERLRIRSSGNVVINNSTGSVLEMTRTSTNTSGLCGKMVFGNTDWDSSMASVQAYQDGGNDNASLRFYTQASAGGGELERLRIASTGQVSISSDGTTDGLLTIKGNSDQVATPSIRLLDGSDTREVSISNTSGDFVVSVHGNDNAIHGHIKMFESGIIDFNNGGATGSNVSRLRIDSSGRVSIGDNNTQTSYPFYVAKDLDSGGNLLSFGNTDSTYSQSLTLSFDSNKDMKWAGGSGSGGLIWDVGTRGHVFKINGSDRLQIHNNGGLQIGSIGNVSAFVPNASGITGGLMFTTPVYSEYHYTWSGQANYTIDLTCGSYFHSEFIYVQHQTNGGTGMHHYVRGKWANNHQTHTCIIHEYSGDGAGLDVSFVASDQSGNGSINGESNMTGRGAGGDGYTNGGGENYANTSSANGRLRISETYSWGSVSNRGLIVRCYYGSFAISKS